MDGQKLTATRRVELRDLLERLLEHDPARRPRIEQVVAHPFVGLAKPLLTEDSDATITESELVVDKGVKRIRSWFGRLAQ
jgi:serine/threonine protein kinase